MKIISKKVLSLMLAIVLSCFMGLTAFASEAADAITPFASQIPVQLTNTSWSTVSMGEISAMFATNLSVTNHIENPDDIRVRITSNNGQIIQDSIDIELGESADFQIPANANNASYFYIEAQAVDYADTFLIVTSIGNQGEDLQVVTWVEGMEVPILFGALPVTDQTLRITVTNHRYSAGTLTFRILDENGITLSSDLEVPRGSVVSADVLVDDYSSRKGYTVFLVGDTDGSYFITTAETIIEAAE